MCRLKGWVNTALFVGGVTGVVVYALYILISSFQKPSGAGSIFFVPAIFFNPWSGATGRIVLIVLISGKKIYGTYNGIYIWYIKR